MDMNMILPMVMPFLPIVEENMPMISEAIGGYLPQYLDEVAKEHKVEKVLIILDTQNNDGKLIPVIKFMSSVGGRLEVLKKSDGSPFVEPASKLFLDLSKRGIDYLVKMEAEQKEKED